MLDSILSLRNWHLEKQTKFSIQNKLWITNYENSFVSVRPGIIFRTHIHLSLPSFLLFFFFLKHLTLTLLSHAPNVLHLWLPSVFAYKVFFSPAWNWFLEDWRDFFFFLSFFFKLSLLPSPNAIAVHFPRVSWADCRVLPPLYHVNWWRFQVLLSTGNLVLSSKLWCCSWGSFVWSSLRIWGQLDSLDLTFIM